ncbi:alpha/beta hydrolase [Robertkochia aurantiaca]|uniref:alpha/beta hydrolase n=1 Tax=Robertkochia aurantiaca TaxID=2873700 RepID=UPI001CCBB9E3|nr:alpha/beta hydrolase-fold protein [Robertkochia sp. 3YJGBD-33]
MKNFAIVLLGLLFCIPAASQKTTTTIHSFKLDDQRKIHIYTPEDYDQEKEYPLLVVLDGDVLFDLVTANVKYYTGLDEMPGSIVVGIEQKGTRYEDTFYSDENGMPDKTGNQFFEFIGMELIPYMEKNYKLANFKGIIGHGSTANYLNYFLFKKSPLFDAYISLSPSLAPNMEQNIPGRMTGIEKMRFYYLATSANDDKENNRRINILHNNLNQIKNENLYYYFGNFETGNHYSVASYAIPQAMDQIFKIYKPISIEEYKEQVLTYDGPPHQYLLDKYTTIENLFGFKKPVTLNDFMAIYAAVKKKEDYESLNELSEIAKEEYPNTMLGFYLEAEYLEQMGEPKKAMRTYEKAFGMKEIDFLTKDHALEKIDRIKADFGW